MCCEKENITQISYIFFVIQQLGCSQEKFIYCLVIAINNISDVSKSEIPSIEKKIANFFKLLALKTDQYSEFYSFPKLVLVNKLYFLQVQIKGKTMPRTICYITDNII